MHLQMAASGLGVAILILICWTRCLAVLARWVVHVLLAAALHGSLRVTRTEAAAAVPRGVTFRQVLGFECVSLFQERTHLSHSNIPTRLLL